MADEGRCTLAFNIVMIVMPVLIGAMFLLVLGLVISTMAKSRAQWNQNNASPVLTVPAKVTAKRTNVFYTNQQIAGQSYYYATFEVESGDRMELPIPPGEYGLLAEGDAGKLTFQGTRYLRFERFLEKGNPNV